MEEGFRGNMPKMQLNIYAPKNATGNEKVMIYLYGGSWKSGNKEMYNFFGKRLAKKGIIAVLINYPLSPDFIVTDMAYAAAQSVKWTYENIADYGGNPMKIFISGHSAGGHLASLITLKDDYILDLGMKNPIKGAVLIDAAGLDMHGFLKKNNFPPDNIYIKAFTTDSQLWKESSPIYFVDINDPPLLIMMGGKTLPGILSSTERFMNVYKQYVSEPNYKLQKKKTHAGMILQFFNRSNIAYDWIEEFMEDSL